MEIGLGGFSDAIGNSGGNGYFEEREETGCEFAGALLRPMAEGMNEMIKAGETALIEGIFKAAKQAGHQLIKDGRISEDMEKAVSRELMPRDAYYRAAQEMIEQMRTSQ